MAGLAIPKRRPLAVLGGAVVLAAVAVVTLSRIDDTAAAEQNDAGDEAADTADETAALRTATAAVTDLTHHLTVDADLVFDDPVTYAATVDGTVTRVAEAGDLLERGDVLHAVDEQPTVVLWGDLPLYRPLADGAEGDDVAVLESNLRALGHDAGGELRVDGTFDAATTEAVNAFQEAVGQTVDGRIEPSDVVVMPGPATVTDVVVPIGSSVRAGSALVAVETTAAVDDVFAAQLRPTGDDELSGGVMTSLPEVGRGFETGNVVYELDTEPVVALVADDAAPFDRTLESGVDPGDDVEVLETALAALGFDDGGALEVDDEFDEATAEAVAAWQRSVGLPDDGVTGPHQWIILPGGATVADIAVERGDEIDGGDHLLTVATTTARLEAEIDEADRDSFAVGQEVAVMSSAGGADGESGERAGTVVSITDGEPAAGQSDDGQMLLVTVDVTEPFDDSPSDVEVRVITEQATQVVAVPASALLSTGDGGYAVEVVRGDTTAYVAVEPAMFADGLVEVTGIDADSVVVIP